jgi:hypothetical protein
MVKYSMSFAYFTCLILYTNYFKHANVDNQNNNIQQHPTTTAHHTTTVTTGNNTASSHCHVTTDNDDGWWLADGCRGTVQDKYGMLYASYHYLYILTTFQGAQTWMTTNTTASHEHHTHDVHHVTTDDDDDSWRWWMDVVGGY